LEINLQQGVVMDPAIFRWYALDMTKLEYFRFTPRTVFGYFGVTLLGFYMLFRICMIPGVCFVWGKYKYKQKD
jgi:hypothetical protein